MAKSEEFWSALVDFMGEGAFKGLAGDAIRWMKTGPNN
jgi:hypothetical protein